MARKPIKIFISYSHKDEGLKKRLIEHLTPRIRLNLIEVWHDRMIGPGIEWAGVIEKKINSARIILLGISASFISSKYCYEIEMKRALERHGDGKARVIPIILRPSDWQSSPFGQLNPLPENGLPVVSYRDRDDAFTEIARAIGDVVDQLNKSGKPRARPPQAPPPVPTPGPPGGPSGGDKATAGRK
jgi:hypothetical protein